jgi:hypothetical protein
VGVSGEVITLVTLLITMTEVRERIAEVIRYIVVSGFEIFLPIINLLGISLVAFGLMLAMGLRQEFLGWRLIVIGVIMLVFVHVIAPFLMSFI